MNKAIEIEDASGSSNWKFTTSNEPVTQLERQIRIEGNHRIIDVQGPLNMCAQVTVKSGTTKVRCGDLVFVVPNNHFVFMPAYSIVEWSFENVQSEIVASITTVPCFDYGRNPMLLPLPSFRKIPRTLIEFQTLAETICNSRNAISIARCSKPSSLSRRVKKLIDENFSEDVKISELSKNLSTSLPVVSRQFKREYGLSPAEYRKRVRIIAASFRLTSGEDIVRASHETGYPDLSGFYKHFREIATVPPARFSLKKSKNTKK